MSELLWMIHFRNKNYESVKQSLLKIPFLKSITHQVPNIIPRICQNFLKKKNGKPSGPAALKAFINFKACILHLQTRPQAKICECHPITATHGFLRKKCSCAMIRDEELFEKIIHLHFKQLPIHTPNIPSNMQSFNFIMLSPS